MAPSGHLSCGVDANTARGRSFSGPSDRAQQAAGSRHHVTWVPLRVVPRATAACRPLPPRAARVRVPGLVRRARPGILVLSELKGTENGEGQVVSGGDTRPGPGQARSEILSGPCQGAHTPLLHRIKCLSCGPGSMRLFASQLSEGARTRAMSQAGGRVAQFTVCKGPVMLDILGRAHLDGHQGPLLGLYIRTLGYDSPISHQARFPASFLRPEDRDRAGNSIPHSLATSKNTAPYRFARRRMRSSGHSAGWDRSTRPYLRGCPGAARNKLRAQSSVVRALSPCPAYRGGKAAESEPSQKWRFHPSQEI